MDVLGKCILEIKEDDLVYIVVKLNDGEIKLYRECNHCFIAVKVTDTEHNCEVDSDEDEGYCL